MKLRAVWTVVCLVGLLMVSGVAASGASAEPLCTDTWVGPSEGTWREASDWSGGKVPSSSDVACLGSTTNVGVTEATAVGVVEDQGRLDVEAKTFEISNALEASSVKTLHVSGGATALTGAATLEITSAFEWEGGIIAGSGQTVLLSGASATLSGGNLDLSEHTFVNEGTSTLSGSAEIVMFGSAAKIVNKATFKLDNEYGIGDGSGKGPTFLNEGMLQKPTGAWTTKVAPSITNAGTVEVQAGYMELKGGGTTSGSSAKWVGAEGTLVFGGELKPKYNLDRGAASGKITFACSEATVEGLEASHAQVDLACGSVLTVAKGSLNVEQFTMEPGYLNGPGSVTTKSFICTSQSYLSSSTSLTVQSKGTGEVNIGGGNLVLLDHSILKNEGTFTWANGGIITHEYAKIENNKTFLANSESWITAMEESEEPSTRFINRGLLERNKGSEEISVYPWFENYGRVRITSGKIRFRHQVHVDRKTKRGKRNKSARSSAGCSKGDPVNCQTGNFYESQTDIAVGGRGVGLDLMRTYNAQAAAEGEHGAFGYGWSSSFGEHLTFNSEAHTVTVVQEEGATVTFTEESGKLVAPAWTADELTGNGTEGYTLKMSNQIVYKFSGSGRLESVTDRNGNKTSLSYNEKGQLATITDPDSRTIKLAYNGEGLVESATDPMGHVVKYAYESGNLVSVTMPGESSPRWKFKYDGSHRITTVTNGLGGETKNTYNEESQVTSQTDPTGHTIKWEYEPFSTKITNEATGSVTLDEYTSEYQPSAITYGYGTENATTETFAYNERGEPETTTDGDGHTTSYEYDSAGDKTSETDPEGHESKWTYNSHHQVTSETLPGGETTSIEYDEHGNPVKVSRPAPEEKTQVTKYEYNGVGELTAMVDPLEHKTSYGYDEAGDRTSETSPEGEKTTWSYNEDSQQTGITTPRGNVEGGKPSEYTTTIERNAQGLPTKVTEPEPAQGKPVDVVASSISGVLLEKLVISASVGVWEGASTVSYAYQWQRCNTTGGSCTSISGATKSTYTLASADVGHTLRVVVTASNLDGSAASTSQASALVGVAAPLLYASQFGSYGTGAGELYIPYQAAVDSHGNVWVSDVENDRVVEFSSAGAFVETVGWGVSNGEAKLQVCTSGCRAGIAGSGEGQFNGPAGIAVSGGDIYVADFENGRVDRFTEAGEYVGSFGTKGSGAGQLKGPTAMAASSAGDIWVVEQNDARVSEFTAAGSFVETVGWGVGNGEAKLEVCTTGCRAGTAGSGNGEFSEPEGVTFDGSDMYVVDTKNNRVQEFNEKSEYVTKFGSKGTGDGDFEYPEDIAVSPSGEDLYVTDFGHDRVEEFSTSGKYLAQFAASGAGAGQLNSPTGLAINSSGDLYVVDDDNNRVQEWKPAGAPVDLTTPAVSGKMVSGQSLSAGAGTWSGVPSPTYTYQWKRCNTSGESCTNISGATSSTHTLVAADAGHALRVAVTASNTGGSSEALSPATPTMSGAHSTSYAYDADGNLESVTDSEGNKTKYTDSVEDQQTKVEEPDGASSETEYNGAGEVVAQTNGDGHTTKYTRNALGLITEISEPGARKTKDSYDADGNLESSILPSGKTTSYTYYSDGKLKKVSYSDGTPTVEYAYNADGMPSSISDGTGTTSYSYNQLDELTKAKDGHGDTVSYEYNIGEQQTKITYPNGKSIEQAYDKDGRLHTITDWLTHTTTFAYDPDSDLTAIKFPTGSEEEDTYTYDNSDQPTETKMLKGGETLASLLYSRNNNEQVTATTSKGLPGTELETNAYDANSRLTTAGSTGYKYDNAGNITQQAEATYKYNEAEQLETAGGTSYTYNTEGQRTKTTPATGPATTYGYDQAGNLTSVNRPEEGSTPKIEDSYTYNGETLRASETIKGTTSYLTWNTTQPLPLLLSNSSDSYIYGPEGAPIEQINTEEHATYLHHDQQGSTRLITGEKGETLGSYTYTPYGAIQEHTGSATTALGYDAQYTNADTGLIYLRAREYDPATAQFLSIDPAVEVTHQPYAYTDDNPLNYTDPSGRSLEEIALPCPWCAPPPLPPAIEKIIAEGIEKSANAIGKYVTSNASEDEGEAALHAREEHEANCGHVRGKPNFNNSAESPGDDWEWRGKGPAGSKEGSWVNRDTGEKLHPDLEHAGHGPHYDYEAPDGSEYRIYPDGRIEPK